MNKIFRVIWNKTLGRLVVTSELAKGECKASSSGKNEKGQVARVVAFQLNALAVAMVSVGLLASMVPMDAFGDIGAVSTRNNKYLIAGNISGNDNGTGRNGMGADDDKRAGVVAINPQVNGNGNVIEKAN